MPRSVFINLPVKDLDASKRFYTELGFEINQEFTDATASAVVVDESIYVMLLTEARFKDFINGEIADATATTEVLNALSAESREEVDELAERASAAGAKPWRPPMDEGPMYSKSFQDLDGHVWEVVHMDLG